MIEELFVIETAEETLNAIPPAPPAPPIPPDPAAPPALPAPPLAYFTFALAAPPAPPAPAVPFVPVLPATALFVPIAPVIVPLLISFTPPGNDPVMVNAGVAVDEEVIAPLRVAITGFAPSHPAASA